MEDTKFSSLTKEFFKPALAFILIGAAWWASSFQRAEDFPPEYSLLQAVNAVNQHDFSKFNTYVNSDSLLSGLIDDMLSITTETFTPKSELESIAATIGMDMVDSLKPKMVKGAKKSITKFISRGIFEYERKGAKKPEIDLADTLEKATEMLDNYKGVKSVRIDDEYAFITLDFFHKRYQSNMEIELILRKVGNYWQVIKVGNFADLYRRHKEFEAATKERTSPQPKSINLFQAFSDLRG